MLKVILIFFFEVEELKMSNDFFTTSNRIKKTPFTSRNEQAGVKKHSVYNNTLIPTIFKSLKSDYLHLIKYVQLWDVCCQKVIEIMLSFSVSFLAMRIEIDQLMAAHSSNA